MDEQITNKIIDLSRGYVVLPRSIIGKFSSFEQLGWFVDLVMMAAYKPRQIIVAGHSYTLQEGELYATTGFLCERWGKSRPTVVKFLNQLQELNTLKKRTLYTSLTIITICDYDVYKGSFNTLLNTQLNTSLNTIEIQDKIKYKTNTRDDARACASVEDFDALVAETFASRAQLEQYCMTEGITPEQCRQLARAVTNEWQMTGVTHTDTTDARRHLLAAIRAKARAKRAEAAARPQRTREEADEENYRAAMERIANSIKNSRI